MTKRKTRAKSASSDELIWSLDWLGEKKVIRIAIDKHALTNGFRKLALTQHVDRSFRKTITAIRSKVRNQLRREKQLLVPIRDANQFVAEMRAQTSLEVVKTHMLPLLKEDLADLLSICSSIATDTIAERYGLPRDTPVDFLKSIHKQRKKRIGRAFKTGRKRGQKGPRSLSKREKENRASRLARTLAALARVERRDVNLTGVAVAKEIGISSKQFREVWLPDLLKQTDCEDWEQFITRKNRALLAMKVKGSQKLS